MIVGLGVLDAATGDNAHTNMQLGASLSSRDALVYYLAVSVLEPRGK